MRQRIVFNGIEYGSPEEMPAEIRVEYDQVMRLLADRNGNGTPDVVENAGQNGTHVDTRIYTDASRLTPADRQLFDRLRSGANGNGERVTAESVFNVTLIGNTDKGWAVHLPPETRQLVNRALYLGILLLLAALVYLAWPR
jgi:hypothetical protein